MPTKRDVPGFISVLLLAAILGAVAGKFNLAIGVAIMVTSAVNVAALLIFWRFLPSGEKPSEEVQPQPGEPDSANAVSPQGGGK